MKNLLKKKKKEKKCLNFKLSNNLSCSVGRVSFSQPGQLRPVRSRVVGTYNK